MGKPKEKPGRNHGHMTGVRVLGIWERDRQSPDTDQGLIRRIRVVGGASAHQRIRRINGQGASMAGGASIVCTGCHIWQVMKKDE